MIIELQNTVYKDVTVRALTYSQGRLALRLIDSDEMNICTASVNIPDAPCTVGHCYIKDYSENEGLLKQLVDNGIISQPIKYVNNGYTRCAYVKYLG